MRGPDNGIKKNYIYPYKKLSSICLLNDIFCLILSRNGEVSFSWLQRVLTVTKPFMSKNEIFIT